MNKKMKDIVVDDRFKALRYHDPHPPCCEVSEVFQVVAIVTSTAGEKLAVCVCEACLEARTFRPKLKGNRPNTFEMILDE